MQVDSKNLVRLPAGARRKAPKAATGGSPPRGLASESVPKQTRCPHCLSERICHWGAAHGIPRYRCNSCKRTFNILTNTPLARLRNRQRWLTFLGTMLENRSIRKSAAACGVSVTTSSRWHKRFTQCSSSDRARILREIVLAISSGSGLASGRASPDELEWAKELLPAVLSWLV